MNSVLDDFPAKPQYITSLVLFAIVSLLAGCATHDNYPLPPPPQNALSDATIITPPAVSQRPATAHVKIVTASWYGSEFRGRTTATGETFDPNKLTAASDTIPLGSVVKVTNPANGRAVKVRINDRGPAVRGRSLDLSHRAAEKLGMTKKGVARVKVESATPSRSPHPPASDNVAAAVKPDGRPAVAPAAASD